jgi:predicted DNA-binding protein
MSKSRSITMRLDAELEARLKAAADKDRRPMSQFVRLVLIDAVSEPKPEPEVVT